MNANFLMNCLWYEDISPEQLADTLALPTEKLFDKIFGNEEFTTEETKEIAALLGLTDEETNEIFG